MKYLIQFVAGTQDIVTEALARSLQDVRLNHVDDSALVFESSDRIDQADRLPFANNTFIVLTSTPRKDFTASVQRLTSRIERVEFPRARGKDQGFRVMAQIDGQLMPLERRVRRELEREIEVFTQSRVQPKGSCREYWIVGRKTFDELLFCLRLPKSSKRQAARGELAPELCHMLVAVSRPDRSDTFLDPFAGHGGLVLARLESPARSILYSDIALPTLAAHLPRGLKSSRRVRLLADDALSLPSIRSGEIEVIVTDPPWGEFSQIAAGYERFVDRMGESFDRVLHPTRGRFVILIARSQSGAMTASLTSHGLRLQETHGILVNGHPATVIVGGR